MNRKFCTNCGAAVTEGAAFCVNCGAAAVSGLPPAQPPQQAGDPAIAPGPAPTTPPAYQPASPPAYAPPPAPGAIGYAPPPAPGATGYVPPQPAKQSNVLRWVIIFIGVGLVLVGLARMMNGLGMITGGSGGGSSSFEVSEVILVGNWVPIDNTGRANCAIWLSFNNDRTLTDNAGNAGTWSLRPHGGPSGRLTMTINNMPARSGDLRMGDPNNFTLEGQTWRRRSPTC